MRERLSVIVFVSVVFVLGWISSAEAQTETKVQDVKALVGNWVAYITNPRDGIQRRFVMTIKEDGSYTIDTGGRLVAGAVQLTDGKLTYQSTLSKGTVTMFQNKGKRTLRFTTEAGEYGEYEEQK